MEIVAGILTVAMFALWLRVVGLHHRVEALEGQLNRVLDIIEKERDESPRLEGDEWKDA